jgi:hypothetical protein
MPASTKFALTLELTPSAKGPEDPATAPITGGALSTIKEKITLAVAPCASVAVIVTDWPCNGPSVVAKDQLQVPETAPVRDIDPTEAISVTASPRFIST